MKINKDKLLTLIGEANKALGQLKSYAAVDKEKLISSKQKSFRKDGRTCKI